MKAHKNQPRLNKRRALVRRAERPLAMLLAVSMALFAPMNLGQAAENRGGVPASASVTDRAGFGADYRLAPGDRLNIVVYDQPQLSGDFFIDGGGGILLPLAGPVEVSGMTLAEAQKLIQERFADGVLVQPAVNVRINEYRPIFVTGSVRKPGSYPFAIGQTVKAAVAAAGGEGEPFDPNFGGAASDYITAEQRVRQLEADHAVLLMRKARLEAQRDARQNFIMPTLVGLGPRSVEFDRAYSIESETFLRLAEMFHSQIQALESQRPRIDAEIKGVSDQMDKQVEQLEIVRKHLAILEHVFAKGLLRKEVLVNQQIQRTLVEGQIAYLTSQVARLKQTQGDLDIKLVELKASYLRQTLAELQETSQRLREVETSIGPARRLLQVKAQGVDGDESEYTIRVSRVRNGGMTTFEATDDIILSPGDVVEVKLKPRPLSSELPSSTEARREMPSTIAEGTQPTSSR